MKKIEVKIGDRYGRLVIISEPFSVKSPSGQSKRKVLCRCDCGNEKEYFLDLIRRRHTSSCGCYNSELITKRRLKHGLYNDRIYHIYRSMLSRCYNENNVRYNDYGGRGIIVCNEWKNDFSTFLDWSYNNGYDVALTLDRIDNNGKYEPCNCRWTTMKVQSNNRRNNNMYFAFGEYKTLSQWCDKYGKTYDIVKGRLKLGWSLEDALKKSKYEHKN